MTRGSAKQDANYDIRTPPELRVLNVRLKRASERGKAREGEGREGEDGRERSVARLPALALLVVVDSLDKGRSYGRGLQFMKVRHEEEGGTLNRQDLQPPSKEEEDC